MGLEVIFCFTGLTRPLLITLKLVALGVPPAAKSARAEKQNLIYNQTQRFNEHTTQLKTDYIKDRKSGGDVAKVRAEWDRLQAAREKKGVKRQPMSTMLRAPGGQAKREKQTIGDVQYNRDNKRAVEARQ